MTEQCYICKDDWDIKPFCSRCADDEALFCKCGHSFGQHSKGPIPALYCRHCTCEHWEPASPVRRGAEHE